MKKEKTNESKASYVLPPRAELEALVGRVNKDNPASKDVAALEGILDNFPQMRSAGNVCHLVSGEIVKTLSSSRASQIFIEKHIEDMKKELGYYNSTFVEKMLIEEIILRWLRLHHAEVVHSEVTSKSYSIESGIYHEKRVDLQQKRYLRAMETLAKVRKMIGQTQAHGAKMFKDLIKGD